MAKTRKKHLGRIRVIGVPMDLGAGRRGVDMGPSAIRIAGVTPALEALGFNVIDDGDIDVPEQEAIKQGSEHARYLDVILKVCNRLRLRVRRALKSRQIPLVLGGDHSIAMGTVSGVAEYYRDRDQKIGLIWVDAHGDMNIPATSPSGNVHGMSLAALLGGDVGGLEKLGGFAPKVSPEHVCLIGIRNLDDAERERVQRSGVHAYTMRDLDQRGMRAVIAEAMAKASDGTAGFHVSFDLDSLDPREAPGVGTPVKGGINWREASLLMEMVADSHAMLSLEVTELNPILDVKNQSGQVAVDLILSAFGKRIL